MTPTVSAPRSYWSQPGGKIGTVFPFVVIGIIVFLFGSQIGDFVVNALDNILHTIIVGTISLALLWVLFDSKFRTAAFYIYRSVMRSILSVFINIDPIGILKTYKERMAAKLAEMGTSMNELHQQSIKTTRLLQANAKELDNEYHLVEQAQKIGDERKKALEGKQVVRLEAMKARYEGDLNRITLLTTIMNRYYGLCEDTVTDMDREIKYRQDEAAYAKSSRNVVRSASAILKGLPEKDMWDDGVAALENQYTAAIGEVDNFLDVTKNILSSADLQDGADASKAMELLDAWQKKNSSVALGGAGSSVSKAAIIQDSVRQLGAATSVAMPFNTNNKPQYATVGKTTAPGSDDDYLSMVK